VNCLVVVVLLAFPPLSVLKQASSPYHSEASSVVSTLYLLLNSTTKPNPPRVLEVGELDLKTGFLQSISLGLDFFLHSLLPASFLEFSIPPEAEVTRQQFPSPQFLLLDCDLGCELQSQPLSCELHQEIGYQILD
jgi:hypothetical protein